MQRVYTDAAPAAVGGGGSCCYTLVLTHFVRHCFHCCVCVCVRLPQDRRKDPVDAKLSGEPQWNFLERERECCFLLFSLICCVCYLFSI